MLLESELEKLDLEGFDFFGTMEDLEKGIGSDKKTKESNGSTEINMEDYNDEQFRYTCPKCGFRFN